MSDQRPPRWEGMAFLVIGLAVLSWEWSRNHDAVAWWPSWVEIFLIILSPLFCIEGLKMLLARRAPEPPLASRSGLFGLLLGIVNAYLLGVWRSVSGEGLRELAPWLLIPGLLGGGVIVVRQRRAKARADASQK